MIKDLVVFVVVTFILTLFLLLTIFLIDRYRNYKIVVEKSERIKRLIKLNTSTKFKKLQECYVFYKNCKTKNQYDKVLFDKNLLSSMSENEEFYSNLILNVEYNKIQYKKYVEEVEKNQTEATIEFCKTFNFSLKKFLKYEDRAFTKNLLKKPQLDVTVRHIISYQSPQGRNSYTKSQSYNLEKLKENFLIMKEQKRELKTRRYQMKRERAKMSDSIRYRIFARDGYRCQVCGATAKDAKLHVDHIIPVAKGGKTEDYNLRTLCERCNMGKSDKIY